MNRIHLHIVFICLYSFLINSCIEPITIEPETFDEALVVEAIITNELKRHKISLSRTYSLNHSGPATENNAKVIVLDDQGNTFTFFESTSGNYISSTAFAAEPNRAYRLSITTSNGKNYESKPTILTSTTQIDEVNIKTEINDDNVLGVSVYVNSFDPSGNSNYYRYEYEETYKIIAPRWSPYNSVITDTGEIDIEERSQEEEVCFKTQYSTDIIQTQTTNQTEDRVTQKLIRFLPSDDFIISHRYSILVKQYVQSLEAYSYYRILDELSSSESLLSQNQPGFITGNIMSVNNANEKVIGFFDVSSVSTKRIFFNFREAFPDNSIPGPQYFIDCELFAPLDDDRSNSLREVIRNGSLLFYLENSCCPMEPPIVPGGGPHVMVIPECGDCTTIGSNIVPDFWTE